jgi:hypothetical protein
LRPRLVQRPAISVATAVSTSAEITLTFMDSPRGAAG